MSIAFGTFSRSPLGVFVRSALGVRESEENEVTYAHAASTANLTLSGTQTVDGIVLAENDFCLAKNQTDTTLRDLYKVKTGAWTRMGTVARPSPSVHVLNGIQNGRQIFSLSGTTYSSNKAVYG